MKVVYGYKTTERVGKKFLPAMDLFDGPEDGAPWVGRLIANDEAELDRLFNKLENAVELE